MHGPEIMARSISAISRADKFGNPWQYHPQSDRHSKIACWAIMFDLLQHCPLLRNHVIAEKVGFGINHKMQDFQTGRHKDLDLVVCTPRKVAGTPAKVDPKKPAAFADLVSKYGIVLLPVEQAILDDLPVLPIVQVGSVNIALEAKATMTDHIAALPRLHDELDSSHGTIHGHADSAIAAALVMINFAAEFLSPGNNKRTISAGDATWNRNPQPKAVERTVAKVREIRRRTKSGDQGFDAIGIVVIDFKNDGSRASVVSSPPAPLPHESDHYINMIQRMSSLYATKFSAF